MPLEGLFALLASVIGLATLFFKWYVAQDTPERRKREELEGQYEARDDAARALQSRDLDAVKDNIRKNIIRIKAQKAVQNEKK